MRKTLSAVILATGISVLYSQDAGAVPANAPAVREAASEASSIQPVQYAERRTRHGVAKCYRDFVLGPYRCHRFSGPL